MKDFLQHYNMKISVLSPVYIGSGEKIGKKEYIYLPRTHRVIIPDMEKMYAGLRKTHSEKEYVDYMLKDGRYGLEVWLKQNGYKEKDFQAWARYELDAGDRIAEDTRGRNQKPMEIMSFIKDAYGLPYVPGSSLKGMIRTALLAYEIRHNRGNFSDIKDQIQKNAPVCKSKNRTAHLSGETKKLETRAFHTLTKDGKNISNAVNCNLSGLIVSDSRPVDLKQLTLSQKIDYTLDGKEKPLPLMRETLIPGTEIYFEISIDRDLCPYNIETILQALDEFQENCYRYFYSRFKRGKNEAGIVWLGGGCGYLSKTVIYPLFGKDAVKVVDQIYRNTLGPNYNTHKHNRDVSLNLAPHVCKCTRYKGELYDMGMGRIELLNP